MIIAVDGPAASGKGTIAARLAAHYGLPYLDTGLLYRAVGLAVLDGRDIGTVIAPDADVKLYVTASTEVRARRRWKQLVARGEDVAYEAVLGDIRKRDARDGGRDAAPMKPADDAVLLDTSDLDIDAAFDAARRIVEDVRSRKA